MSIIQSKYYNFLQKRFVNQYKFGMKEIYSSHAGLKDHSVLLGLFQHGVFQYRFMTKKSTELDVKSPRFGVRRSPLYVYSVETTNDLLLTHGISSIPIGAPWCYINFDNGFSWQKEQNRNRSLIIFPEHTSIEDNSGYPVEAIKRRIALWKEIAEGMPITVCLYYTDFLNPTWICELQRAHMKPFCAGIAEVLPNGLKNPLRIQFLRKLYEEINKHTHAVLESPYSSSFFYCLDAGLSVMYLENESLGSPFPAPYQKSLEEFMAKYEEVIPKSIFEKAHGAFTKDVNLVQLAGKLLGRNNLLSPTELKSKLKWVDIKGAI